MEEYWTSEVEEALAKYVTCENIVEKNKIFDEYLFLPINKLIDVILERYAPYITEDLEEVKTNLLYSLVVHVQKFNPNKTLKNGKKVSGHSYCSIIVRSALTNCKLNIFREKRNVRFEECHEIYLNKIQ